MPPQSPQRSHLPHLKPVRLDLICVPNGIRTRAAALKARNWAFVGAFQDLSLSFEICCDLRFHATRSRWVRWADPHSLLRCASSMLPRSED